jgi:hypothetical protein
MKLRKRGGRVGIAPAAPYKPLDMSAGTGYQPNRPNVGLHFRLFVLAISLMAVAAFLALGYVSSF